MFCVRNIYLNIALLCLSNNMETRSYPQKTFTLLISLFCIILRATTLNKTVELALSLVAAYETSATTSCGVANVSRYEKTTQIPRQSSKRLVDKENALKDVDFPES